MHELCFRAWNVRRFLKEDEVAILPNGKMIFKDRENDSEYTEMNELDVKISFYTGLKDKNGKEIYEGDIVKGQRFVGKGEFKRFIGVVSFRMARFEVQGIRKNDGIYEDLHGAYEVIGNIHENPELLEGSA